MFFVDFRAENRLHFLHRCHLLHLMDDALLSEIVKVPDYEGLERAAIKG